MPHRSAPVVVLLACLLLAVGLPAPARAEPAPEHRPPVEAPVVDGFRPPTQLFGPGNRGLEYGTAPGTDVRATADGTVVFAGSVAGSRHVTVRHADGIRTSYSFLDQVTVARGQRVRQGDVVGTTAGALHLGARMGDSYLDPATLFERGAPRVHLVPFDLPLGLGQEGERSAIRQLIGGVGRLAEAAADRVLSASGASVEWLRDKGPQLLRTALHYLEPPMFRLLWRGFVAWQRAQAISRRPCTEGSVAAPTPPPERRLAITVAGLASTSEHGGIDDVDTGTLGYDDPDVIRFSYQGGRTPTTGAGFPEIEATRYGKADTQTDLRASASGLADLVEDVVAAEPGVAVDLFAHSQGGVVTRLALIELERRHGAAWLQRIGLVALLATPNDGADLATGIFAIGSTQRGSQILDGIGWVVGLDDDATGAAQLSELSDVAEELRSTPVPPGLRVVSIAARGDLIVPVPRTYVPGATSVVVSVDGLSAHSALPGSEDAHRELALAQAGMAPGCESFRDSLVDGLMGEAISMVEDQVSSVGWLGTVRLGGSPLGG